MSPFSWNLNLTYRFKINVSIYTILSQMNTLYTLTPYVFGVYFNWPDYPKIYIPTCPEPINPVHTLTPYVYGIYFNRPDYPKIYILPYPEPNKSSSYPHVLSLRSYVTGRLSYHLHPGFLPTVFSSSSQIKMLYKFLISPTRYIHPAHFIAHY